MSADQVQVVLTIVTLAIAGFALYMSRRRGETIDLPSTLEAVQEAKPMAVELMEVAQIAVNAVEQLKREGKIQSNDVAFNYALDYVKKWVPDRLEADNEDVIMAINSAVLVASALSKQAGLSTQAHEQTKR